MGATVRAGPLGSQWLRSAAARVFRVMRAAFVLDGEAYSRQKASLKTLLANHGLKWRGTLERPWWGNSKEKLTAVYERDEARNLTTGARLTWEGTAKSRFLNDLKAWVFEAGGREATAAITRPAPEAVGPELEFWDSISRPDLERMAADGMPKKWVERERSGWKKRREEKLQELDHRA